MSRKWQHRLEITDDDRGENRQQRRDRARATRQPSSPRGRAPTPPRVLAMALRLRESNSALDHESSVPDSGLEPGLLSNGGADLSRSRSVLRRLSRLGRVPNVR